MAVHPWILKRRTLEDAYLPRDPIAYVADKLFALPSLNIVYGPPGCLKSLLMADLVACIVGGLDWLPAPPWPLEPTIPVPVLQSPALWLDFDNGENRTSNRFEALGRHYKLDPSVPLVYYSMPAPILDASKTGPIDELKDLINSGGFKLVVIDNLATISGGHDENSSEMMVVMSNLRLVAEKTGAALVIIHHSRKENGYKGKQGDNLRGFSGIRGAIDTGLYVEREPNSEIVTVRAEKSRDVDIPSFGAMFTYTHKPGCHDLETAAFFGAAIGSGNNTKDIEAEIVDVLNSIRPNGALSQIKLAEKVKAGLPSIGINRIKTIINQMAVAGKINVKQSKTGGSYAYSI